MFLNKKILVGITGSISAYKMYQFIRQIKQNGALVKVIVTQSAKAFVSNTLLSTFSEHKVYCDFVEDELWQNHVHLGRWADLFVIAPASCNSISKLANGMADNFLIATYLSCAAPVLIFPAMDEDMWLHPSTQDNITLLRKRGNTVIEPATGVLASGIYGKGRLLESEEMITLIESNFFRKTILSGRKILITAGPTEEPIDPVRVITNRSSGKMGYAIAESLYMLGADVYLVSGPVLIELKYSEVHLDKVNTANEMFEVCNKYQNTYDIAIFTAAVADYTIEIVNDQKIKKSTEQIQLNLIKTKDILGTFGKSKNESQKVIGFALETENEEKNAKDKLHNKNADLIVMNHLSKENGCFHQDAMRVSFIDKVNCKHYEIISKKDIANNLSEYIINNWI